MRNISYSSAVQNLIRDLARIVKGGKFPVEVLEVYERMLDRLSTQGDYKELEARVRNLEAKMMLFDASQGPRRRLA